MALTTQEDFDISHKNVAQMLMSDNRRVFEYESDDGAPFALKSPLLRSEYQQFIGKNVLVTFTLKVPLRIVVGGDFSCYIQTVAFADPVHLTNLEYRAVGASFDSFEDQYSGRVHLQMTCSIEEV